MYLRHGAFSYLPELTDDEIAAQVRYVLDKGWPVSIEYTDDPHPRNYLWEMWKQPNFDLEEGDGEEAMKEINECRKTYPNHYIKVVAYDAGLGKQTSKLSFIVNRPAEEPGFRLLRTETHDRTMNYTLEPYATEDASGRRYGNKGGLGTDRDPGAVQDATAAQDSPIRDQDGASSDDTPEAASDEGIGES